MGRLDNKVAIITGAAGGMGAAEARLFVQEGAKVLLTDIQEEKLKETTKEIANEGGAVSCIAHDVASPEAWERVIEKAIKEFGGIDILVNNAGITGSFVSFSDSTYEDFQRVMKINLDSQYLGIKSVIEPMKKRKGGSIINISSIAGLVGVAGVNPAYIASKGASRLLTKQAAQDLIGDNIRVNSVHPGGVKTDMVAPFLSDPEVYKQAIAPIPAKRFGEANEVAYAVVYLASDESTFTVGAEFVIDGGQTIV